MEDEKNDDIKNFMDNFKKKFDEDFGKNKKKEEKPKIIKKGDDFEIPKFFELGKKSTESERKE